jgi:hypothetical protein
MLKKGQWGLLPEEHILDEFLRGGHFRIREKFPDFAPVRLSTLKQTDPPG